MLLRLVVIFLRICLELLIKLRFQVFRNMKSCFSLVLCVAALTAWGASADAKELSITTIKETPYVMGKGSELEGYCIDLISEISQKLGLKYKTHLVKDGFYGQYNSVEGTWNGMIGEIVRGEADLAVAPLTLTAAREQAVDMTTPFLQTGISFILRRDMVSDESGFSLFSPFSSDMWAGVLIAFLLTGVCMFLVGRLSPSEWSEPHTEQQSFTLLHSFWYITGALTLQGAGPHPKALSLRLISAIWWLFGIMLLACYFGNFNAILHSDQNQVSIKTFEDLANQDVIEYGTIKGGSTKMFFKTSEFPLYRRIYENMERKKSFVASTDEGVRRAQEGNFAFIGEAASLDLVVARYCDLMRAQEITGMRGYSIAAPMGSPLVKNLTNTILQLSESGKLTYLRDKWWASRCVGTDSAPASGALHTGDLRGLFLLLGLGLTVGLLLALLELLSRARNQAKDGKKSCCSVLTSELHRRFVSRGESTEGEGTDKSKA